MFYREIAISQAKLRIYLGLTCVVVDTREMAISPSILESKNITASEADKLVQVGLNLRTWTTDSTKNSTCSGSENRLALLQYFGNFATLCGRCREVASATVTLAFVGVLVGQEVV